MRHPRELSHSQKFGVHMPTFKHCEIKYMFQCIIKKFYSISFLAFTKNFIVHHLEHRLKSVVMKTLTPELNIN